MNKVGFVGRGSMGARLAARLLPGGAAGAGPKAA